MGRYSMVATSKSPADIMTPLFERELALGAGIPDPLQQAGMALNIQRCYQLARNFMGLVKAALTKA